MAARRLAALVLGGAGLLARGAKIEVTAAGSLWVEDSGHAHIGELREWYGGKGGPPGGAALLETRLREVDATPPPQGCRDCVEHVRELVTRYVSQFSMLKSDSVEQAKLFLTLEYIIQQRILAILVVIRDGKLEQFQPFINWGSDTNIKGALVRRANLKGFSGTINSIAASMGWTPQAPPNYIIDRCMAYVANAEYSEKLFLEKAGTWDDGFYYHVRLFKDMLVSFLDQEFDESKINKVFFMNMFDHPIILSEALDTKYLLSPDTESGYADIPFPHADAWLQHVSAGLSKGNHYKDIQSQITEYLADGFDIAAKLGDRVNQVIFRGSLTGCHPSDVEYNKRLKLYQECANENSVVGTEIFNVKLTGFFRGVIFEDKELDGKPWVHGTDYASILGITDGDASTNLATLQAELTKRYLPVGDLFMKYRYVLSLDGYVSAWRMVYELLFGNIVFVVTRYTSYISPDLKHGENCFLVDSASHIRRIIQSLTEEQKRDVAVAAHRLGKHVLSKATIFGKLRSSLQQVPDVSFRSGL